MTKQTLTPEPKKSSGKTKKLLTQCEFICARITNFAAALVFGFLITSSFVMFGDYPDKTMNFFEENYASVALVPGNWPAFIAISVLVYAAVVTDVFTDVVVVVWDGFLFAIFAFTMVAAVLTVSSGDWPTIDKIIGNGVWRSISITIFGGGALYLFLSYPLYHGLVLRENFSRFFCAVISLIVVVSAVVLKLIVPVISP